MRIELNIERLILDGFTLSPRERALLRASAESELTRLISGRGLAHEFTTGGATPSIRAGGVQLSADSDPRALGTQIARAVYRGIGNSE